MRNFGLACRKWIPTPNFPPSRTMWKVALASVLLLALAAVPGTTIRDAQAQQDDTVLVSTFGEAQSSTAYFAGHSSPSSYILAQGFSTGGKSDDRYQLSSAVLHINSLDASVAVRVSIYSQVSLNPGRSLYVMTNPASVPTRPTTFTAPSGAVLNGDTDYFVVIENTASSGFIDFRTTESNDESGLDGWTVSDTTSRKDNDDAWKAFDNSLLLTISGSYIPSTDATLSDLRLTGAPVPVQLTPEFRPNTTSYTARVANSAAQITVRPTTNNEDASVEYLDGSNNTVADADDSAGGHQVNVAEGDNTIKVKVTAEDGTTTRTYTVTVTRTPSVTFWTATLDVNTVVAPAVGCDEVNLFPDYKCSYALSENEFTLGSTTYTVWRFIHPVRSRTRKTLYLKPNTLVIPEGSNLTLHADATPLPFVQADRATSADETVRFIWHETGNQWSSGDTVQLRITGSGLNAAFESPQTVDGVGDSIRYQLDLKLSEPVQIPHAEMRDHAFDVTNGTVVKAKRVARFQREHQGRRRMFSDHWRITVEPTDPDKNVTVVLQGKNCNQRGAVCNPYGDGLLTSPSIELEAPEVPLSVVLGAASANEDQGYLDFPVTLTRETKDFVEINFNSFEGFGQGVIPATAGEDFVPVTGGLRLFAPGETSIVIRVNLINDDVAEETERVGVKLTAARLVNPENLRVKGPVTISFGEAFGEILDTDPTQ